MFIDSPDKVDYGSSGAECCYGRTPRTPLERVPKVVPGYKDLSSGTEAFE
jgi:hypothetical protein